MQTIPLPTIRPSEMLLKVGAAGYCHTDTAVPLNVFGGPFPLTGSHEPAGTVVALGDEVSKAGKFKVGDRVMAVNTCKKCGTSLRADEPRRVLIHDRRVPRVPAL